MRLFLLEELMNRYRFFEVFLSVLTGIAGSLIFSSQYLHIWAYSPVHGGALFVGSAIVLTFVTFFLFYHVNNLAVRKINRNERAVLTAAILIMSGLIILVIPLPHRMTPDQMQVIEIKPLNTQTDKPVLIEEIKINSNPQPLSNYLPSSGWQDTFYGVESQPETSIPFVIKKNEELSRDVEVLLAKGPDYGQVSIRLNWDEQVVDLQQEKNAEVVISLPDKENPELWAVIYSVCYWLLLFGLIYTGSLMAFSSETIRKIASFLEEKSQTVFFWLILGFLFWFGIAYVQSVFLNPSNEMQNGNFLPAIRPIGTDLNFILDAAKSVTSGGSPYAGANKYPPLAALLFIPLSLMDKRSAYQIILVLTYLSYIVVTLIIPYVLSGKKKLPAFASFLFAIGFFSYGLSFEIERGQFNLIAICCALLAVTIFHKSRKYRWLAYILITIAIQLKLYPAIFVLFLIDDWKNWKRTLFRWSVLGIANISLIFVLGLDTGVEYFHQVSSIVNSSGKSDWPGNHSIQGFLNFCNFYLDLSPHLMRGLEIALQIVVLTIVLHCFDHAWRRNNSKDPTLFLACTITALVLPALSHDYTLSYLTGPVIYFCMEIDDELSEDRFAHNQTHTWITSLLLALFAFSFTGTYFSYMLKPFILHEQFPLLLVLLGSSVLLSFHIVRTETIPVIVKNKMTVYRKRLAYVFLYIHNRTIHF